MVAGKEEAGYKTTRWDAASLSNGIYFYRLQVRRTPDSFEAGDFVETRKMVLIR